MHADTLSNKSLKTPPPHDANLFSLSNLFVLLSIVLLFDSTLLILFSSQFISVVYDIISQKIFHRDFSIEKWLPLLRSFILIPACSITAIHIFFFVKYTTRQKIILLFALLFDISLIIIFTNFVGTKFHVDSDLASEIWLGKECVREHTFWPTGWYYSTEFRLLNTQIFSALGFLLSSNWSIVKTFQSICSCAILFFSVWYLMKRLQVKTVWLRFLSCILVICPWSYTVWYCGSGFNYYIPHIVISFFYFALFIDLIQDVATFRKSKILFYCLAFISGLSSIRYILILTFPLAIASLFIESYNKDKSIRLIQFKSFWLKEKSVFYSISGLFASGFGYICNSQLLHKFWDFTNWNTLTFNTVGEITFRDILAGKTGILSFLGFTENIVIVSIPGLINILVYIAIIMLFVSIIYSFKSNLSKPHQFLYLFFFVNILFNCFVFIHTEYSTRFFYPILIYIIPIFITLIDNQSLSKIRRYFLGIVWSTVILFTSFFTIQTLLLTDSNKDKHAVCQFLLENNYDFGYSTTEHSTQFTFLSNGKIEVGNLVKDHVSHDENGEHCYISTTYEYDTFLSPAYIYSDENHKDKKIFFLVSQDQYAISPDLKIWESGRLVYEDEWYRVYDYENHAAFKNGF